MDLLMTRMWGPRALATHRISHSQAQNVGTPQSFVAYADAMQMLTLTSPAKITD